MYLRPSKLKNCVLITACSAVLTPALIAQTPLGYVSKLGVEVEVRSGARMDADQSVVGNVVLPDLATPVAGVLPEPQIQLRGGNQQASDPALDYTQIFPGFRPFVHATQSEVSTAASGRNIV